MSWQETRKEYCGKHQIHYTATVTLSGDPSLVGDPAHRHAGSIIRSSGECPECAKEKTTSEKTISNTRPKTRVVAFYIIIICWIITLIYSLSIKVPHSPMLLLFPAVGPVHMFIEIYQTPSILKGNLNPFLLLCPISTIAFFVFIFSLLFGKKE